MTPHLADTSVLETDRLVLRAFGPQDFEAGMAFLMDPRTRYMGGPHTRAGAWDHCCQLIGHWAVRGYGLFAIRLKGQDRPIGDAGLIRHDAYPEPEIGWGIWQADLEGQGIAFEAAQAVRSYAYGVLGWETAVSYIDPDNARSITLAERLGCTRNPEAALPALPDWEGTLVYRHPAPDADGSVEAYA